MKFSIVFWYWIIGCLLVGSGSATHQERCPTDRINGVDMLAIAAMWPAVITYGLTAGHTLVACDKVTP